MDYAWNGSVKKVYSTVLIEVKHIRGITVQNNGQQTRKRLRIMKLMRSKTAYLSETQSEESPYTVSITM